MKDIIIIIIIFIIISVSHRQLPHKATKIAQQQQIKFKYNYYL